MTITRRKALEGGAALSALAVFGGPGTAPAQSGQLIQKRIPKSREMLPPIGIGTNRYGVGTSEEERAPLRDTMARFVELGGKVMDTAMIYGTSEAVIGDLSEQLGIRDKLFFATKTDLTSKVVGEAGVQQSLARLRTDRIDLFQVHNLVNLANEVRRGEIQFVVAAVNVYTLVIKACTHRSVKNENAVRF